MTSLCQNFVLVMIVCRRDEVRDSNCDRLGTPNFFSLGGHACFALVAVENFGSQ